MRVAEILRYSLKPSVIVQNFTGEINQKKREAILDFVAELRIITEAYGYSGFLNDILRSKLIVGINDDGIQRLLTGKNTMTFQEDFDIAVGIESVPKFAGHPKKIRDRSTKCMLGHKD